MFPYLTKGLFFQLLLTLKKTHYSNSGELNQTIKTRDNVCGGKNDVRRDIVCRQNDTVSRRSLLNEKEIRDFHMALLRRASVNGMIIWSKGLDCIQE